jgi:hypothetical protein
LHWYAQLALERRGKSRQLAIALDPTWLGSDAGGRRTIKPSCRVGHPQSASHDDPEWRVVEANHPAVATLVRAGFTPPATLVNGAAPDSSSPGVTEAASLVTSIWVTKDNMADTVVKDGAVKAADLCAKVGASVCTAHGIGG